MKDKHDFGLLVVVSIGVIYTLLMACIEIQHRRNMEQIAYEHSRWCMDFAMKVLNETRRDRGEVAQ